MKSKSIVEDSTDELADKIFKPFFATKSTGEVSCLGFSLNYNIVKTHGGKLKVETNEESRPNFLIKFPI